MVFLRRLGNRDEIWLRFCDEHEPLIAATGLPRAIVHNESRLRDLLRDGIAINAQEEATLSGLTSDQWGAFEQFATIFFRVFESYAPLDLFPAFRCEQQTRGDQSSTVSLAKARRR